jgi:hypothetical protein
MKKKTSKSFDCVASKRKAHERIFRKIKGMTNLEEVRYFDKATHRGPFGEMWRELVAKRRKAKGSGRLNYAHKKSA